MVDQVSEILYICPRCLEPAEEPTLCPNCGGKRVRCRPGSADDPCRKPLMAASGEIRGRAPIWWLRAIGVAADEADAAPTS